MKIQKVDKTEFFKNGLTVESLPQECRTCFGYSNWGGSKEEIAYEDRDCNDCPHIPIPPLNR